MGSENAQHLSLTGKHFKVNNKVNGYIVNNLIIIIQNQVFNDFHTLCENLHLVSQNLLQNPLYTRA